MSIPLLPPSLLPVPAVQTVAITLDPVPAPAVTPLDFLFVTSRDDFGKSAGRFTDQCKHTGVHTELVFIEDLPGRTAGEKLASLHTLNGDWQAAGKITGSTIKILMLHGAMEEFPDDASLEEFGTSTVGLEWTRDEEDEEAAASGDTDGTAEPVDSDPGTLVRSGDDESECSTAADTEEAVETDSDSRASSDDESADDTAEVDRVHCTFAGGLTFPTELIDCALRSIKFEEGELVQGNPETIIYSSCYSGNLRDAFKTKSATYVLTDGKKPGLTRDTFDGLKLIADETARRKSEKQPLMSGRDCWMQMKNVTGEHIAYVGDRKVEIHKVLEAGHSEPVISVKSVHDSQLAKNVLIAKLSHGSARALQRAIDRFGREALLQIGSVKIFAYLADNEFHSAADLQEKMDILRTAGVAMPEDMDNVARILDSCIKESNWDLLSLLLKLDMPMVAASRVGPPGTLIGWLLDMHRFVKKSSICEELQQLCKLNVLVRNLVRQALFEHLLRCKQARQVVDYELFPEFEKLMIDATLDKLPGLPAGLKTFVGRERDRHPDGSSCMASVALWSNPADQAQFFFEQMLASGWDPEAAKVLLDWLAGKVDGEIYRRFVDDIFSQALFRNDFDAAAILIPYGCTPKSLLNDSWAGNRLMTRMREKHESVDVEEIRSFFIKHGFDFVWKET